MKIGIAEAISEKLIAKRSKNNEISELEKKKVTYGVYVLYVNITKVAILLTLAYFLNVFYSVLLIWCFFALIRKSAFGIHCTSSISCTLGTVTIFIGGALITKYFDINNIIIYTIYILSFIGLLIYAPADTESRPLTGKKFREKLKRITMISFMTILAIVLALNTYHIKMLFAVAVMAETICVLPVTYKIFNRRYHNYEYKVFPKSNQQNI